MSYHERVAPLEIDDRAAARFLTDIGALRLLEPFSERACSVKTAADLLGIGLQNMYYRVRQMLDLGLLEIERIEPRQGRAIKHYRATANAFFIPLSLLGNGPSEELGRESQHAFRRGLDRGLDSAFGNERGWGIVLHKGEHTVFSMTVTEGANGDSFAPSAAASSWHDLRLDRDRAKALLHEITTLIDRYRQEGGGERYLLRFAFAPIEPAKTP